MNLWDEISSQPRVLSNLAATRVGRVDPAVN